MSVPGRAREGATPSAVKKLLREGGISPRRSMGQNFLVDSNILSLIDRAAGLEPSDTVVEVGPGLGSLTRLLVERCERVLAVESDPGLATMLQRELAGAGNLVIVKADALKLDLAGALGCGPSGPVKMVSNLPYRIAATLLIDWLERYPWIESYTVMVQREVAGRLSAAPGGRDYSAASVKVRARADVRKVAPVSRNSFHPRPKVDSAIIRIDRLPAGNLVPCELEGFFDDLVTAAFAQRRKKLANALSASKLVALERDAVTGAIGTIGRDPGARAEEFSPGEFARLAVLLSGSSRAAHSRLEDER